MITDTMNVGGRMCKASHVYTGKSAESKARDRVAKLADKGTPAAYRAHRVGNVIVAFVYS